MLEMYRNSYKQVMKTIESLPEDETVHARFVSLDEQEHAGSLFCFVHQQSLSLGAQGDEERVES